MPISSTWGDDRHRSIIVSCISEWSWDELHHHEQTTLRHMVTAASQAVSLLIDIKHGVWVKPDSLQDEVEVSGQFHHACAIPAVVFVVSDAAIGTLLLHMHQKHGSPITHYYQANTLDHACLQLQP